MRVLDLLYQQVAVEEQELAKPAAEYLTFASSIAARVSQAKAAISPKRSVSSKDRSDIAKRTPRPLDKLNIILRPLRCYPTRRCCPTSRCYPTGRMNPTELMTPTARCFPTMRCCPREQMIPIERTSPTAQNLHS